METNIFDQRGSPEKVGLACLVKYRKPKPDPDI